MKPYKKIEKQYIYIRDGGICRYCRKDLQFGQASLDHYLPRSKDGPDDVFNLVLSCKRCNKLKKSQVPEDWAEMMAGLFKKAVRDRKIEAPGLGAKHDELAALVDEIIRVEAVGRETVFQSGRLRFYVRQNKIRKMVRINMI